MGGMALHASSRSVGPPTPGLSLVPPPLPGNSLVPPPLPGQMPMMPMMGNAGGQMPMMPMMGTAPGRTYSAAGSAPPQPQSARQPARTKVAVVGGGMMGRGIAACLAAGGADVAIFDVNADGVPAAVKAAEELVSFLRMNVTKKQPGKITGSTSLEEAV